MTDDATEYDPTEPVPGLQQAITGVVMPPISASYRDALLEVKGQVERTAAMHESVGHAIEAIARAHRNMGLAVNGLLAAIGALIKAQEAEAGRPEPVETAESWRQLAQDIVNGDEDALLARLPPEVAEAMARDRARNPRGHPCRDCGRYFDEHRGGGGDCGGWR